VRELEAWGRVVLEPGETIISVSSGGGGYAPARERDPEHVRHDVAEGWVTAERARSVYGVALAQDGSVDEQATAALRDALAAGEPPSALAPEDPVARLITPGEQLWPTGARQG
jgi:N-methylhydantoinase B